MLKRVCRIRWRRGEPLSLIKYTTSCSRWKSPVPSTIGEGLHSRDSWSSGHSFSGTRRASTRSPSPIGPPKTYAIPTYILKKVRNEFLSPKTIKNIEVVDRAKLSDDTDFNEEIDIESVIKDVPDYVLNLIQSSFLRRAKKPNFPQHLDLKIEYEEGEPSGRSGPNIGHLSYCHIPKSTSHIDISAASSQEGSKLKQWKDCPKDLTTVIPEKIRNELQNFYLRRFKKGESLDIGITVKFEEQEPTPAEPYYTVIPQYVLNQVYT